MSDLIKRLRQHKLGKHECYGIDARAAADEIERLRAQVEALTAAATTLLDQIRDSEMHGFGAFEQDCPECAAVKALSLAISSTDSEASK